MSEFNCNEEFDIKLREEIQRESQLKESIANFTDNGDKEEFTPYFEVKQHGESRTTQFVSPVKSIQLPKFQTQKSLSDLAVPTSLKTKGFASIELKCDDSRTSDSNDHSKIKLILENPKTVSNFNAEEKKISKTKGSPKKK